LANKEVYELIKNGVPVSYKNAQGVDESDYVKALDFGRPEENELTLISEYLNGQNSLN